MPRNDPIETAVMRECQRGLPLRSGGSTGSICRKPQECRADGRCHFVGRMERFEELHPEQWMVPSSAWMFEPSVVPLPLVLACCAADASDLCAADCPRHHQAIVWQAGYDGYAWAL